MLTESWQEGKPSTTTPDDEKAARESRRLGFLQTVGQTVQRAVEAERKARRPEETPKITLAASEITDLFHIVSCHIACFPSEQRDAGAGMWPQFSVGRVMSIRDTGHMIVPVNDDRSGAFVFSLYLKSDEIVIAEGGKPEQMRHYPYDRFDEAMQDLFGTLARKLDDKDLFPEQQPALASTPAPFVK